MTPLLKRTLYSFIIILSLTFTGCTDLTPSCSYLYSVHLLMFNEDITDQSCLVYVPATTTEFQTGTTGAPKECALNTITSVSIADNNKDNFTQGWNPEENHWIKMEFPPNKKVYALLYSPKKNLPVQMTPEEERLFHKMLNLDYHFPIPENDPAKEEKLVLVSYIQKLVSAGYSWAAASGAEDTELWMGDRP